MPDVAQADAVEYRVYADVDTAYIDAQDGNLDIVDVHPARRDRTAPDEFGDRFIDTQSSQITYLGLPDLRRALRRPAGPSGQLDGHRPRGHRDGDLRRHPHPGGLVHPAGRRRVPRGLLHVLHLRLDAAKELLDEAGFDPSSRSSCGSTRARGHDAWMEAVGNQLRTTSAWSSSSRATRVRPVPPVASSKGWTAPTGTAGASTTQRGELPDPAVPRAAQPPNGSNYSFYSNPEVDRARHPG